MGASWSFGPSHNDKFPSVRKPVNPRRGPIPRIHKVTPEFYLAFHWRNTSISKCSHFVKLGHCRIQIRTLRVKYGQYPEADGNRLAIPEPFLNSADADRMSVEGQNAKYSQGADDFRFAPNFRHCSAAPVDD